MWVVTGNIVFAGCGLVSPSCFNHLIAWYRLAHLLHLFQGFLLIRISEAGNIARVAVFAGNEFFKRSRNRIVGS